MKKYNKPAICITAFQATTGIMEGSAVTNMNTNKITVLTETSKIHEIK
jgi:hypothetical protein